MMVCVTSVVLLVLDRREHVFVPRGVRHVRQEWRHARANVFRRPVLGQVGGARSVRPRRGAGQGLAAVLADLVPVDVQMVHDVVRASPFSALDARLVVGARLLRQDAEVEDGAVTLGELVLQPTADMNRL